MSIFVPFRTPQIISSSTVLFPFGKVPGISICFVVVNLQSSQGPTVMTVCTAEDPDFPDMENQQKIIPVGAQGSVEVGQWPARTYWSLMARAQNPGDELLIKWCITAWAPV